MNQISAVFENFAFKAFDFNGRATVLEYWAVMPLLWGFILWLLYGDAVEFWGLLLDKQVPTFNPFYWDGIFVFLLTFIPRLSLTVRRLHDSGKNGKWAKLPFLTVSSSLFLTFGLFISIATSNMMNDSYAQALGGMAFLSALVLGTADNVWDSIFAAAALLNAMGWDVVFAVLAELTAPPETVALNMGLGNTADAMAENPAGTTAMLLVLVMIVATPFVTAFLHLFFMISPAKPDHALDNTLPMTGASLRKQGVTSDNPFAGYKHLYEKSDAQKEAARIAAKEEIRSLYQHRVLGSQ